MKNFSETANLLKEVKLLAANAGATFAIRIGKQQGITPTVFGYELRQGSRVFESWFLRGDSTPEISLGRLREYLIINSLR